jgi:exopolysaccharide production protein ExoQ
MAAARRAHRPRIDTAAWYSHIHPASLPAMLMLAACLVLGGGGTSNPMTELVLELVLPAILLLALWLPTPEAARRPLPRAAIAIAAAVLLLPVVQLIPLPPALWHSLPGRQPEVASLALIGAADHWMPISLTPARTFASLLAILAEIAVFLAAARLDLIQRTGLCIVIVAIGLVSVLMAGMQLSQVGGYSWALYAQSNVGWALGFHANRNAETDVLQIAVLALAVVIAGLAGRGRLRRSGLLLLIGLLLVLTLDAVLTGSRTGLLLLPLTYLFTVWILYPILRRRFAFLSWGVLVLPVLACGALALSAPVQRSLGRFGDLGDRRWIIWHDTLHAVQSVWPLGGGISSFQVIYDATQGIEHLIPEWDVRAHNDWLEWVLEAGLPGIVLLVVVGAILLGCNIRALRAALRKGAHPEYRAQIIFATGTLLHLGLHALLDYPMRSMALVALAATAAAMLVNRPQVSGMEQ